MFTLLWAIFWAGTAVHGQSAPSGSPVPAKADRNSLSTPLFVPPAAFTSGSRSPVARGQNGDDLEPWMLDEPGQATSPTVKTVSSTKSDQETGRARLEEDRPVLPGGFSKPQVTPAGGTTPQRKTLAQVMHPEDELLLDEKDRDSGNFPKFDPMKKKPGQILRTSAEEQAPAEVDFNSQVVEVRVEGNDTIQVREIEKHIKVRPNRTVNERLIKQDVDALVRTRWFTTVEPYVRQTDEGLVVIYRVLERPIVRDVQYIGNQKIKTSVFEGLTNLKPGSPYDISANRECARRIEAHYKDKGYSFATCTLEKGDSRDEREVVFRIHEGPKVGVDAIRFEGNEFFSDSLLKTKKVSKTRVLRLFGGKYDESTIPDDKESLRQYYHSLGFFEVEITHRVDFNESKSSATYVYVIKEGPRYKIRNISVEGNNVLTEAEIRQYINFKTGDPYSARDIATDVDKIRSRYGEQGRLFATVDAIPQFLETPGELDLIIRINEDKIYVVREFRVHIEGDYPHTRHNLPRNISRIHPGDLADPKLIKKSERQLAGSEYFEGGPQNGPRLEISRVSEIAWLQDRSQLAEGGDSKALGQSEFLSPKPDFLSEANCLPTQNSSTSGSSAGRVQSRSASNGAGAGSPSVQQEPEGRSYLNGSGFSQPSVPTPSRTVGKAPSSQPSSKKTEPDSGADDPDGIYFMPGSMLKVEQPQSVDASDPHVSVVRGQTRDMRAPQNYEYDNSPQGDPYGNPRRFDQNIYDNSVPPEFIDIDAYLKEARTGRLMFGVGVNSDAGVIGNIVLSESNFDIFRPPTSFEDIVNGTAWRGAGQRFRLEAAPGSEVSRYTVDWSDPYFMDSDYNIGVSGFYYTRFLEFWQEQRLGVRPRVGRQLTPEWSVSGAIRIEDVQVDNPVFPQPESLTEVVGSNFLTTGRIGLAHDTRDAPFNPSEGHFIEMSYEQAFGDFVYPKLELNAWQYFTTYRRPDGFGKHILSLHADVGWTGSDTPIFENFYAGGFQSFRGFRFRGVSPVNTGVRTGGNWMFLGGAEYQMPVTANEMLHLVAFTDFGTVTEDVTLNNFRLSVGGGLRITLPAMGPAPIALDWAVPIMKEEFDRTQLFSFYIGFTR
ncbi:outer membrane protein assembly complex, YaeT protein [Planctopirus limnophila DSM 3776]|uniref:Outer membrane protein assembly complex, YaeT protein n=1 Tax=Planctopirus limnophila (strain ATCC 43296 / DSM 3776 / IFAM 1008 / Mu 290) TaxID=521674 RepID=D5SP47_PLAL2|nr:BamA/TamA family outer membrane protein [Planctopirus limnophila]ADG68191.1 outer membrane protein assembly complex, YaeT protein [Planctopirus limnophila DSM 3776]